MRFWSLHTTACCWVWGGQCTARAADGAVAALPCPCTDAGALGLPALKSSRRDSKGELAKEDLAWPLALAGTQEVSAPPGGE